MTTKNAVALRAFTHADDSYARDQVILGIDPGHLADWSAEDVGLVREATADEARKARGEKPETAPEAPARKAAGKKAPAPAPTPADQPDAA